MKKALKIILLLLILLTIYIVINPGKQRAESGYSSQTSTYLYLNKGDYFSQKFICNVDDLNSIAFSFKQDFYKDDDCEINIKLLDGDKIITSKKLENYSILSDARNFIYFDEVNNSLNKEFTIEVRNTCDKTLAINFYDSTETDFTYNGQKMNKGLSFKIVGEKKTNMYLWYPLTAILVDLLALVMLDNKGEKKNVKKNNRKNKTK